MLPGGAPPPTSPVATAQALVAAVQASGPHALIGKLEVSGPGYINIYLAHNYVLARLTSLLHLGPLGCRPPGEAPRTTVVDYSSPNIAKDMHIGHLRSTIIGDALARLLEFAGHTVHRVNHVGDWGTQFGMLIAHLKDLVGSGAVAEGDIDKNISDLTGFYKAAKRRFDAEPEFKARSHREVVALQAGDAENLATWRRMVRVSSSLFADVYAALGIDPRLAIVGESFYNPMIPGVIGELQGKGLLETSDGALIMRVPGQEVPLMVRKGDGGYGYDSTDLAALHYRLHVLKANWLIYVVDSGQALHFDLVFAGAARAGWWAGAGAGAPQGAPRIVHTGFGVVQGEDRKKFKTRDGSTVRLLDVLQEARTRAMAILVERGAGAGAASGGSATPTAEAAGTATPTPPPAPASYLATATQAEIDRTACSLGYGGVKYFDLRQNRTTDYVFSYERMLSPDGDTAVYLQYSAARLASILRKAGEAGHATGPALRLRSGDLGSVTAGDMGEAWAFAHPTEIQLAGELLRFAEVLASVQEDLMPHKLCEYMYGLSGKATDFHRDCNVLGSGTAPALRAARLRLVQCTSSVLTTCMRLLGLEPLERI